MRTAALLSLASLAAAEILWDGRFNDIKSVDDIAKWSWSNQVGPYQYYIHGPDAISEYVALSSDFANPADKASSKGTKISLTKTSFWNGQNMRRTELIPQTSAKIASGKVFYHFSLMRKSQNAPSVTKEHQIAFFESHFTEMKSGLMSGAQGSQDTKLRWFVDGKSAWDMEWEAGVWHNCAYEIDFSGKTVGFWHSTDAGPLKQVVAPVKASTSSNGADWHVGVLELPKDGSENETEDFLFSGVYIEDGEITTVIGDSKPAAGTRPAADTKPAAGTKPVSSTEPVISSEPVAPTAVPVAATTPVADTEPIASTTSIASTTTVASAKPAASSRTCTRRRKRTQI